MSRRERRQVLLLAALLAGVSAVTLSAPAPARRAAAREARNATPTNEFPPGAGQEIAARSCALCHSAMLVTQQAKDSTGWEKTITLMEKCGAPVRGAEHDTLRSYLLVHFGARSVGARE